MSRLIVKGLPSTCTEAKLRAQFEKFGKLTDCTLKFTKEGKFRRFAFVGYESEQSAEKAIDQLNNTFLNTSKIQVEECRPFGDEAKPRAWSKYAIGSSAYKRAHPDDNNNQSQNNQKEGSPVNEDGKPLKKKSKLYSDDKQFKDFLAAQNSKVKALEADDEPTVKGHIDSQFEEDEDGLLSQLLEGISGDTTLSLIVKGLPVTIKQKSLKEWFSPIRLKGIKISRDNHRAFAFVTFTQRSDVKKALQRNGQFLGGSKIQVVRVPGDEGEHYDKSDPTKQSDNNDDELYENREAENVSITNAILETGRLFLRNLPYSCKEDDLQYLLKKYGEISDLQMIVNKRTGQCKGFAIVTYVFPENAVQAFSALDGTIFKGRMLHVLAGDEKRESTSKTDELDGDNEDKKSAFQKEKEAKLKANAGKAHSWNALFMGANAIADSLAAKLSIEKSDLLSGEGETSAGVRLALAETRLVKETRDFLLAAGVCLDAFSRPASKRSDVVILVKNLPHGVDLDELKRMFERYGSIKRAIMPHEGISALIEMDNNNEAKMAFKALAYSRFRSQPLYLEWAPFDVFASRRKDDEMVDEKSSNEAVVSNEERKTESVENNEEAVQDESMAISQRGSSLSADEKKKLRRSKKHRQLDTDEVTVKQEESEESRVEESKIAQLPGDDLKQEKVDQDGTGTEQTEKLNRVKSEQNDETIKEDSNNNDNEDNIDEEEEESTSGRILFVKNLNFNTTDESLYHKFAAKFNIRSAVVSKKRDPNDSSKSLSMGFGFVKFYRAADAQSAIKEMQGILLDGHCIELKLSHREEDANDESSKRKTVSRLKQGDCTKIMIRNIPFQANRKEVKQLFATFGELRAFRIPKKIGSTSSTESHRGFGFADFINKADAARAFDALVHSTHLYGRRLVLEWAKQDESIEELRDKALSNISGTTKEMRKQKKQMQEIEKDLTAIDDD